jgi:hypothetical protein
MVSTALVRSALVPPRIGTARRPRRPTLGPMLAEVAGRMGVELHPWQRHVADVSLELVRRRNRWRLAAGSVGVVVGRQTGKTMLAACRIALQCLLPSLEVPRCGRVRSQHVAFTAQDRNAALARWHEHVDLLMASELAAEVGRVVLQRGDECVQFVNGSTYRILTPSRGGARGWALDLAVVDEALMHPVELLAAIRPTMAQRDGARGCIGAQLVVVSNAGDERSTLLVEQRELGRRAAIERDDSRVWFEWSAPDDADPTDEDVWRATIPTLGATDGIGLEFLRAEAESMRLDDFRREYLCVHTARPVAAVIDPHVWARLPSDELDAGSRVVLAVDAALDRDVSSVVAAGELDNGLIAVEVIEQRHGSEWVAGYVAEVARRHHAPVVVDAYGPLSAVIGQLGRIGGVRVRPVRIGQVVDAAAGFCDLVASRRIAHMRDPRLDDAVANVTRRKVGDRWKFARSADVDVSALVAASLAAWAAQRFLEPAIY